MRVAEPFRRQARKLCGLLEVSPAVRERILNVGREVENQQILPDEAIQRHAPGRFTFEDVAEVAGGDNHVFSLPARGSSPLCVSRRAALDVADGIEEPD
jgi:hypothetical protein